MGEIPDLGDEGLRVHLCRWLLKSERKAKSFSCDIVDKIEIVEVLYQSCLVHAQLSREFGKFVPVELATPAAYHQCPWHEQVGCKRVRPPLYSGGYPRSAHMRYPASTRPIVNDMAEFVREGESLAVFRRIISAGGVDKYDWTEIRSGESDAANAIRVEGCLSNFDSKVLDY